jgi:hypothetical protein
LNTYPTDRFHRKSRFADERVPSRAAGIAREPTVRQGLIQKIRKTTPCKVAVRWCGMAASVVLNQLDERGVLRLLFNLKLLGWTGAS